MSWIWRWRKNVEKLRDSLSKSTQKSSGSLSIRLHHYSQISFASVTKVKRRCSAQVTGVATVNVNILPLVVTLVPDAGLFWLVSVSVTLSEYDKELRVIKKNWKSIFWNLLINVLRQSNVGNAGRIVAQQMDVWIEDGRVDGFTILSQHWKHKQWKQMRKEKWLNYHRKLLSNHIVNYHFQSRIYGNPSLRLDCPATPAQMRLNVNHIFYCWRVEWKLIVFILILHDKLRN